MPRNWIKIDTVIPWRSCFAYVDSHATLADRCFAQRGLHVHFNGDYVKEHEPYRFVFCWVRKSQSDDFLQCMEDLQRRMLLTGHADYLKWCDDWIGRLDPKQ